jgi:nicotinate phosphoribosyltransferase
MNPEAAIKTDQFLFTRPALYTDFYELTMAQGYFLSGRADKKACFDYFFRKNPFQGGYVIFAGLADLLEVLNNFRFHDDELAYLEEQGFHPEFIDYLRHLDFSPTIYAPNEGEIIFPTETIVHVEGSVVEAQLLETLALNILDFESLVATKARRLRYAAGGKSIVDFGLRRAQGFGGILASKAAIIGGADATSNTYSSFVYDLPPSGTMAHSWVQSFENEIDAFRTYANYFPENTILLVDTYDTLASGVPNAIKVAKEMEKEGHRLKGIRLDSGDLAYFSRKARNQLDRESLQYVKIAASNQLDEQLIDSLLKQNAPIDLFGVGSRLVTGHTTSSLGGVYKLSFFGGEPTLKISENVEKVTLPGIKQTTRFLDENGQFWGDGVFLTDESGASTIYHPHYSTKSSRINKFESERLQHCVMKNGKRVISLPSAHESAKYADDRFQQLNSEHKRFQNPHIYKVGISKRLMKLRDHLKKRMDPKS